jgi:hypothetical protein
MRAVPCPGLEHFIQPANLVKHLSDGVGHGLGIGWRVA